MKMNNAYTGGQRLYKETDEIIMNIAKEMNWSKIKVLEISMQMINEEFERSPESFKTKLVNYE